MTKAENVFIKLAKRVKLDPNDESMWTDEGGYSIKGLSKKFNLNPETTTVDTLNFKNPSNFDFKIKGEDLTTGETTNNKLRESVMVTGRDLPSPRQQRIEEIEKDEKDNDPNVFGSKAWREARKNETPEERIARMRREMNSKF